MTLTYQRKKSVKHFQDPLGASRSPKLHFLTFSLKKGLAHPFLGSAKGWDPFWNIDDTPVRLRMNRKTKDTIKFHMIAQETGIQFSATADVYLRNKKLVFGIEIFVIGR